VVVGLKCYDDWSSGCESILPSYVVTFLPFPLQ
jgi:hypothetical protein